MEAKLTRLGCVELQFNVIVDGRGTFTKVFQQSVFGELGLEADLAELFFSRSAHGVIRGMHFQTPPCEHAKLVVCITGAVLDVVVDLRLDAPTYGQTEGFKLVAEHGTAIYVPKGFGHGFATLSEQAIMAYGVTTEHENDSDSGVRWDSIDFDWPFRQPTVSERDRSLVSLSEFESPFRVST